MNILGIKVGHDASVALIRDGKVVADAAEERFLGLKHYAELPYNALKFCLNKGGIGIEEIDIIAHAGSRFRRGLDILFDSKSLIPPKGKRKKVVEFFEKISGTFYGDIEKPPIYFDRFPVRNDIEIILVDHHLAHAASAYYTSGINSRTLIVTTDGQGDNVSIAIWIGENGKITPIYKVGSEGSLGFFYSIVTEALGWIIGDGEGKTMGLAPYGSYSKTRGVLDKFSPHYRNGKLAEPHDFGLPYIWPEKGSKHWHLSESIEVKKLIDKYGREDIAAEAQRVLEEEMLDIIGSWLEKEGVRNLCCAGGVFLNVKLNQRVWYSGWVDNHYIFPNAGDGGLAVGAALYAYYEKTGLNRISNSHNVYWGPEYDNEEIEEILRARGIKHKYEDDICSVTAELLAGGKIVGWFQGRMESGPRALGNRSILMSAAKAENKDVINARVKFREAFRPFCPSLTSESAGEYLVNYRDEPYMITSFDVTEEKREKIPAVVHVDGTLRPQTVKKKVNEKYWRLLNNFGNITGVPLLLNTSFNIKGDPIICDPRQAIRCFYDTGLDYLVLGDFILEK